MSILGLPESTIAELVRAAVGSHLDAGALGRDDIARRFALATWTAVAEPGDRVAVALSARLGAEGSLAAVLAAAGDPGVLLAALRDAGVEPGADPDDAAPPPRGGAPDERLLTRTMLDEALARWRPRLESSIALLSMRQAARFAVSLVVPGDPLWPEGLDDLGDAAPHALWTRGRPERLADLATGYAIVGARAATGYGEHVAVEAASGLADRGYAIVSGAAYGIDGAAHRAALASGGTTIAVLAGGLDRFYPSGHEALIGRIVESCAVVAEVPCGTAPTRWRFLQRNRLIAALGLATVVVEAGRRSGSLNTAGHAAALGRPLGAVPGPVTSSASAGCHRMLRELDAVCVTSAEEMAELAPLVDLDGASGGDTARSGAGAAVPGRDAPPDAERPRRHDPDAAATRVLDALSPRSARTAVQVATASGLALDRVLAQLGLLELEGRAAQRGGGWVRAGA